MSLKAAAAAFSVSPATAHRWWHRWLDGGRQPSALLDRSSRPHRSPRLLAAELQERICDCRRTDRLGSAPGRRRDRLRALDGLEGAQAGRALAARRLRPRSRPTATSGPAPAICCTWTSSRYARFLRPGHRVTGDRSQRSRNWMRPRRGSATTTRTRSSTTTPGSPTSSSTTTRKQRPSPASSSERLAFFAEHGIVAKRLMTDNGFSYVKNRSLRELLAQQRHPPPHHRALPAAHQRQGRALPPDHGTRMGLRARLPLTSTPQRRPATLARQLQPTGDHTAHSATGHRSAAFTTSVGRTASPQAPRQARRGVASLGIARSARATGRAGSRAGSAPRSSCPRTRSAAGRAGGRC